MIKMKNVKSIVYVALLGLLLSGCQNSTAQQEANEKGAEYEQTEGEREEHAMSKEDTGSDETEFHGMSKEDIGSDETEFHGMEKEEMTYGNESARYCQGGMVCITENGVLSVDADGKLVLSQNETKRELSQNVAGGLNFYDNKIFYISAENQNVYAVTLSGENKEEWICEQVLSLLVCDEGLIYTDQNNHLYMQYWEHETYQISDKNCLWGNYYGKWIIYAELGGDKGCPVKAFHLETKEDVVLLQYGFFPTVYEDELFFQTSGGNVEKINLKTGECMSIAEEWGQKFVLIGEKLYFTDGEKLYEKAQEEEPEIVYETEDAVIEKMWEEEGHLVLIEKGKEEEEIWKAIDVCKDSQSKP